MKIYRGDRTIDGIQVTVDGRPLADRRDLLTISQNGFEWSYEGAEPAQLALALLADHLGDDKLALQHRHAFMVKVVANFDNSWEMTGAEIDATLSAIAGKPG